jgi:hypothetical protein
MRVTSGLGAVTTDVSPSVAVDRPTYPSPAQAGPRPLPGPGRWIGTAASLRRTTDYPGVDEDEVMWSPDDRQQMLRSMAAREFDREADRHGIDRSARDLYRGTRQWSDREASDRNRSGPWANRPGGPVGPVGPIPRGPGGFAGPRRSLPVPPLDAVNHAAATMPRGMPVLDGSDPTPLYTATEYVAVGDSPLYQVVAQLIAVGDGTPSGADAPMDPVPMEAPIEAPMAAPMGMVGAEYPEVASGGGPAEIGGLNRENLEPPIRRRRSDRASAAVSPGSFPLTDPPLPTAQPLPTAPAVPTAQPLVTFPSPHTVPIPTAAPISTAQPLLTAPSPHTVPIPTTTPLSTVPLRSSHLDSSDGQGSYSEGGKHRDELRLAGHRSAFDDGRRSARRSPRHRTL